MKTAFIAIMGRPNVGKSTLLNALIGQKVAIVSRKPQTTRNRIVGIYTNGDTQLVFMDTPGMHNPKTKLGESMVRAVKDTMYDVDAILFVVEPLQHISTIEQEMLEDFKRTGLPVILIINKIDSINKEQLALSIDMYSKAYEFEAVVPISALNKDGVNYVAEETSKLAAENPWFFPEDMVTDQPERAMAAEIIREKMLRLLDEEVPHGTAVDVISFEEDEEKGLVKIRVNIYCEKESHKGIIIGKNGAMLKKIATYAREDLETLLNCKVFLECWVKVKENWRDSNYMLKDLGY